MFGQHDESAQQDGGATIPVNDFSNGSTQDDVAGDYIDSDAMQPTLAPVTPVVQPAAVGGDNNDLLSLKQQALSQLTPLLGQLDQSPEEKFRTTMMMIQASDNDALIKSAYEAAMAIPDEKVRAQALLDVVNEINYFTQQNES